MVMNDAGGNDGGRDPQDEKTTTTTATAAKTAKTATATAAMTTAKTTKTTGETRLLSGSRARLSSRVHAYKCNFVITRYRVLDG